MRLYELQSDQVHVQAAPELCFEVVSSAGRVRERYPDGDRLVEFETVVDGKTLVTTERVHTHASERIDYSWVEGPLPLVEETSTLRPLPEGTTLRYEGRFGVDASWYLRPFVKRYVRRRFARAVHEHLLQAKEIAERRARRSRIYPRKDTDASPEASAP